MNEQDYVVHQIEVRQIIAGDNDRVDFSSGPLNDLAETIGRDGLTTPITVKHIGSICLACSETADTAAGVCRCGQKMVDWYRIAAGERRFRAVSTILKWERIPAFIRDMDEEQESAVMLHENVGRVGLNPIEEALAYQKRIDDFSWSLADIAERAGTTEKHVRAQLDLLKLDPMAQEMLRKGQIPVTHAREMTGLPENLQREALKLLGSRDVSFVQFKQYLAQLEAAEHENLAFDLTAFWAEQIEKGAAEQEAMRARTAEIFTSDALPAVRGNRKDTAGDLIVRYMRDLHAAGHESEAAAVGNLFDKLLSLRKVKNFRENPAFAIE